MLTTALNKGSSLERSCLRLAASGVFLLLVAAQLGCGRPFNVKTQPNLAPTSYAAKTTVDSITVEAQAITDEDFLYDTFDANLISAAGFTNAGTITLDTAGNTGENLTLTVASGTLVNEGTINLGNTSGSQRTIAAELLNIATGVIGVTSNKDRKSVV